MSDDFSESPLPLALIVDDDLAQARVLSRWLEADGCAVETYVDGEACLRELPRLLPDVVCLDLHLPGESGIRTLERLRTHQPRLSVIMLTANSEVENIVRAMQLGAHDYLVKPVDRTKLLTTVRNAIRWSRMEIRLAQLEREARGQAPAGMIGRSKVLRDVFRQIDRVAPNDLTVLILGESGTGKELVARAIHDQSARRAGPFVAVNCAAIPESLQESELFGHEKGAFTGAASRRVGCFEEADQGTLFLDEVGELSLPLQAKLLRVLQERVFRRVGGGKDLSSDFRLLAATHRSLVLDVEAKRFREDLFFRLAVFELEIPPLRQRDGDIPLLAQHFLAQDKREDLIIDPRTAQALENYAWPGNVRELQNALRSASVVATGGIIRLEDLPARIIKQARFSTELTQTEFARTELKQTEFTQTDLARKDLTRSDRTLAGLTQDERIKKRLGFAGATRAIHSKSPYASSFETDLIAKDAAPIAAARSQILPLSEIEKRAIAEALSLTGGNLSETARQLQIGRTTLYRKIKKYALEADD